MTAEVPYENLRTDNSLTRQMRLFHLVLTTNPQKDSIQEAYLTYQLHTFLTEIQAVFWVHQVFLQLAITYKIVLKYLTAKTQEISQYLQE